MRQQLGEVLSVAIALELRGERFEPCIVDPAEPPGDLLRTGDLETLPGLDRGDELGRLAQAFRRAGVEPGEAAPELLDLEPLRPQILVVEIGDLELAARRRLQSRGNLGDLLVVEIETGDRIVRGRARRLLDKGTDAAVRGKVDHAILARLAGPIG